MGGGCGWFVPIGDKVGPTKLYGTYGKTMHIRCIGSNAIVTVVFSSYIKPAALFIPY